jgi:hypothetical protein
MSDPRMNWRRWDHGGYGVWIRGMRLACWRESPVDAPPDKRRWMWALRDRARGMRLCASGEETSRGRAMAAAEMMARYRWTR